MKCLNVHLCGCRVGGYEWRRPDGCPDLSGSSRRGKLSQREGRDPVRESIHRRSEMPREGCPLCTLPVLYRTRRPLRYSDLDLNNAAARPRVWPPSPALLQPPSNKFIHKILGFVCMRTMTSICLSIGWAIVPRTDMEHSACPYFTFLAHSLRDCQQIFYVVHACCVARGRSVDRWGCSSYGIKAGQERQNPLRSAPLLKRRQ